MLWRWVRQSAWLLLARLSGYAAMALFTIAAARRLGGAAFGEYAFTAALVVTGNLLTTFGTDMLLIREVAAGARRKPYAAALALQLTLSAVFVGGVFLLSPYLAFLSQPGGAALRLYSLSLFPLAFFTVFTTALRGNQEMGAYGWLNLLQAGLHLLVAAGLYFGDGGLVWLAGALLLAQALAALMAGLLCSARIEGFWRGWSFSLAGLADLARAGAPFALLAVLNAAYQRLALTLLLFLAGALPAGLFAAGARPVELVKAGQAAAFTAMYPMMVTKREAAGGVARRGSPWEGQPSFRLPGLVLLAAAGLASLALSLSAGPLVALLFGEEYRPAAETLRVLAWTIVPYTLNTYLGLALMARGDEAVLARVLAAGLVILAILTAWWGRTAGAEGAAWAALYAESLQAALLLFSARRRPRPAISSVQEA